VCKDDAIYAILFTVFDDFVFKSPKNVKGRHKMEQPTLQNQPPQGEDSSSLPTQPPSQPAPEELSAVSESVKEEAAVSQEEPATDFMRWAASRTAEQWKWYQIAGGFLLGSIAGVLIIFFSGMESIGTFALLGAVLAALFLPQYIARQADRAIPLLRLVLIITLAVWMAASLIVLIASGVPLMSGK
jgi:hypothetical protein